MENIKMTKVEKFNAILEVVRETEFAGFDVVEFLNHEVALLEKRNKAKTENRKPSKTQVENLVTIQHITVYLSHFEGTFFSAKEISDNLQLGYSSQKMTALMKKAVEHFEVLKVSATSNKKLVGYGFDKEETEEVQGE